MGRGKSSRAPLAASAVSGPRPAGTTRRTHYRRAAFAAVMNSI